MIDIAIEAAKGAGEIAFKYFTTTLDIAYKSDHSPVTKADKKAEQFIRDVVTQKFPDHGILGEEFGAVNPGAKYTWVIDPIDGTKDFVRGVACWATLLAVMKNNVPIIGIAYYPPSKNLFVAEKGKGTFLNGKQTHVSANTDINLAYINHSAPNHFEEKGKTAALMQLCRTIQAPRNLSNHGLELVLQGKIDATISARGEVHDFAAPAILVEEAGGKFSDFSGEHKFNSNSAVFSNGHLHDDILKIFKS